YSANGRAVGFDQLQRQSNQRVFAWLDIAEHEIFKNGDAAFDQNMVRVQRLRAEVVHARRIGPDQFYTLTHQPARQVHARRVEAVGKVGRIDGVTRAKNNALRPLEVDVAHNVLVQFATARIDYERSSDIRFDRHLGSAPAAVNHVVAAIGMRAGVHAQRQ